MQRNKGPTGNFPQWIVCNILLLPLLALLMLHCAKEPGGFIRDNPLDQGGINWHPPIVTAMHDTSVAINDSFFVHAIGTDTNGYVKKYLWALDGIIYRDSTDSGFIKTVFVKAGTKTICVKVRDNDGVNSAPDTVKVTVHLYPPVVTAMHDTAVAIYDSFFVHAAAIDTNGTIKKYIWALDGVNYHDTTDSGRVKAVFNSAGLKTIKVKVRDDDGILSAIDSTNITVHLYPPVVTAMHDTSVAINDSFYIHAVGTDTNGTIKKYLWALDGVNYHDSTDSGKIKVAYLVSGVKAILVKVRDNDGLFSSTDTVKVTVHLYAPIVTAMHDTSVAIYDSFFVHAAAIDTNGTIKKYVWALDGVNYHDTTDSGRVKAVFNSAGLKTIKVKVRDDDGILSAIDSTNITVHLYAPSVAAMNDTTVFQNDSFYLHAQGSDSNGVIKKYFWSLKGTAYSDSTVTNSIKTSFAYASIQIVRVKVRDDDGLFSNPDTIRITVRSDTPMVVAMHDTSVSINDSIEITATGSDPNGTVKKYLWAKNGTDYIDTTIVNNFKMAFPDSGRHIVRVKVIDNDGVVSAADEVVVTVRLDAPVVTPVKDTVVSCLDTAVIIFLAHDVNADGSIKTYYWATGAVGWDDSASTPTRRFANPAGGWLSVIWAARDDDGIMSIKDTFTIRFNRPPTAVSLIAPTSNNAWSNFNYSTGKGDLHLALSANDPDGSFDTLTYKVYLGTTAGTLSLVFTGRTPSCIASFLDTSKTYYWRLIARDIFGDSASSNGSFITPKQPPAGMKFITSGTFQDGQTQITISHSFWIDSTEVTQAGYLSLMGINPSYFSGDLNQPVERVTWFDAILYCNARSKREGIDSVYSYSTITGSVGNGCTSLGNLNIDYAKNGFRLSTFAEWEYAYRAGTTTPYYWGIDSMLASNYAWWSGNSSGTAHPVATKLPNAWGLYDMNGNVWEWCNDWYIAIPDSGAQIDPTGPDTGTFRMMAGGSCLEGRNLMPAGFRGYDNPATQKDVIGLRVVCRGK